MEFSYSFIPKWICFNCNKANNSDYKFCPYCGAKYMPIVPQVETDTQMDLISLHKKGIVKVSGRGDSIKKIHVSIQNLIEQKLKGLIRAGTYFVSSSESHQNMASTSDYLFEISPLETYDLEVNAVCINAHREIPKGSDLFIGIERCSLNVARFIEASKKEDAMVIQAGVWTLTDNLSRTQIKNHLVSKTIVGDYHPITDEHIDRAKTILEKLGIPHSLDKRR